MRRFERFLLSVMGPPQVGSTLEPVRVRRSAPDVCRRCGRPFEDHEVVREPALTYVRRC